MSRGKGRKQGGGPAPLAWFSSAYTGTVRRPGWTRRCRSALRGLGVLDCAPRGPGCGRSGSGCGRAAGTVRTGSARWRLPALRAGLDERGRLRKWEPVPEDPPCSGQPYGGTGPGAGRRSPTGSASPSQTPCGSRCTTGSAGAVTVPVEHAERAAPVLQLIAVEPHFAHRTASTSGPDPPRKSSGSQGTQPGTRLRFRGGYGAFRRPTSRSRPGCGRRVWPSGWPDASSPC